MSLKAFFHALLQLLLSKCGYVEVKLITRDELGIRCHMVGGAREQAESKAVIQR